MLRLCEALKEITEFAELLSRIQAGDSPILISGLSSIHKAHISAAIHRLTERPVVCVYADEFDVRRMSKDVSRFSEREVFVLPPREYTMHNVDVLSREFEHERLSALYAMASGRAGVVAASASALCQITMPPETLLSSAVFLKAGSEYPPDKLTSAFLELGYTRTNLVEAQGQFAVRGGIFDFFSPYSQNPVRIEYFGDEIDSMGEFDLDTQRRIVNIKNTLLLPASETRVGQAERERLCAILEEKIARLDRKKNEELIKTLKLDMERLKTNTDFPAIDRYLRYLYPEFHTAADYIPDNAIILIDDYIRISEGEKRETARRHEDTLRLIEQGIIIPDAAELSRPFTELEQNLRRFPVVLLESFVRSAYGIPPRAIVSILAKQLPGYAANLELASSEIISYANDGMRVVVLASSKNSARGLADILKNHGVAAGLDYNLEKLPNPGEVIVSVGNISAGFMYPSENLAVIAEGQLVRADAKRRTARRDRTNRQKISSYQDLSVGCLVVHEMHGIGRFAGIAKIAVEGAEKDYIKIIYAGTDVLYVPVTQLDMVSKYIGAGEDSPVRLNKLGGTEWQRAKSRAKGAAKDLAKYLIKLYARRREIERKPFNPDCGMQREFEEAFEYEETEDQLRCSAEIKADMQRRYPMDRLLCGDVGFGKTEVALRAVMKCVLSGRQAAMLVPTTVLAQQHFITAKHRFAKYPVNIAVISRFNTPAQNRNALKKLKSGEIDFIIGTHKLLQKNVEFNNLGLLIVDEEQRFGVAHKERLKEIASETDVLTLTATPIPRTLNMALSGIRDMSILEEAPRNRHPVQTYVVEYNKQVAVDAIRRELSRGGQVYYVHNRVASIDAAASRIARLIPDISIGVAHGQMDELTLSDVMRRMDDGEIQVLVCTTIIETGIDIPNVNTIIIEDADNMGLAQLHQLRGRVGRSSRHAFAYLTYRRGKLLSEIAEKRLSAVREYVEFGSGFKIAMRDLELRGAGNILGAEQSGHMISVGYDMYLRFLEEAVNEERGLDVMHVSDCGVDLNITANIPEEYIASPEQRMDIYRQIASVRSREDAEDIIDELIDRFGEPPKSTLALIDISLLRSGAAAAGITEISQKGGSIRIVMENPDFARISALCAKPEYRGRVLLNAGQQPYLMLRLDKDSPPFDTVSRFVADYKTTSTEE
jgi:transcription-repair coupling factor (superfamily II helicase)